MRKSNFSFCPAKPKKLHVNQLQANQMYPDCVNDTLSEKNTVISRPILTL
ncbi:hypothetical protein X975_18955, partial [Stegodyphus mimosarum]